MNKFCPNCGKELKERAEVCLNCGKVISKEIVKDNNSSKIVVWVIGIIGFIFVLAIITAIVAPLVTNSARHHTESGIQKTCCQQYGGIWKENTCKDPDIIGVEFDASGYYECIHD